MRCSSGLRTPDSRIVYGPSANRGRIPARRPRNDRRGVASYRIAIKASAAKELDALPGKDCARVAARIRGLANGPRPPGAEKLSGDDNYRVRQGDYRIVYAIDDRGFTVTIVKIGHRREVHRA